MNPLTTPAGIDVNAASVWQWLALPDEELERADLVAVNLAVARGVPSLAGLDVGRYRRLVGEWTGQFAAELPRMERAFRQAPQRYKDDIRFFRVGMLAGFLGGRVGIRYNEGQRRAGPVSYTNPSDLFLNGVIDTRRGTCGNMAALHVAMCRRMGWPVGLASVGPHFVSRFDDGEVTHNVELSSVKAGTFASDPDGFYIEKFRLPPRAVACGSDLRKLTAREMLAVFVALRARHFTDVGDLDRADADYALARAVFPRHRRSYIGAMVPMLRRGERLFERGELGHPDSLLGTPGGTPYAAALASF
jgi:hypothetical protein